MQPLKKTLQAYARLCRLHQPTGIWLLYWPCAWGVLLSPLSAQSIPLLVLLLTGAVVMRAAGCIINDMWDRDFDRKVARTLQRPLASREVSMGEAFILLGLLLATGLAVVLQLPFIALLWAFASLPLIILYPLMKRFTWWPQAFLGLTFNWGILVGSAAMTGAIPPAAWFFYAAGIFWTLGYDTIYACQDRAEDALIGVKSTARYFGQHTPRWVGVFYGIMLALLALGGKLANLETYFLFLLAIPASLLFRQWRALYGPVPPYGELFRQNRIVGALVAGALLLSA